MVSLSAMYVNERWPAMREAWKFFVDLYRHWFLLMGGLFGFLWLIASLNWSGLSPWWLFVLGFVAFVIASFLAWRDQYREAHPYSEERYQAARRKATNFTEDQWLAFERLAIEGSVPADQLPPTLEATAMIDRDYTTAHCSIKPDFALIIPRLIKEWRAGKLPS